MAKTIVPGAAFVDVHWSLIYWQESEIYVCGVTIGDSVLVVNVGGSAGGVSDADVGVEAGVLAGDGVAVALFCWSAAKAVCTARVMIAFGSAVGVADWQEVNKTASRLKACTERSRSVGSKKREVRSEKFWWFMELSWFVQ